TASRHAGGPHHHSRRMDYHTGQFNAMKAPASMLVVKLACLAWLAVLLPRLYGAEEQFRVFTESIEIAERGQVPGYALFVDDKRMSFLSPARWSVKLDAAKRTVHLLPEDLRARNSF